MNRKGFVNVVLIIVIAVFLGAAGYFTFAKKSKPRPKPAPIQTKTTVSQGSLPLRTLAAERGITIGATVENTNYLNEKLFADTLRREFNLVTPGNALKFQPIHPQQNQYNFGPADNIIAFAEANKMEVRGHTLVWDIHLPEWVVNGSWTFKELMDIHEDHIKTVMSRYRGRIASWDVVNEPLLWNGSLADTWVGKLGSKENFKILMVSAFKWARETDPNAKLFISDAGVETTGPKADAFYALVKDLKSGGAPVDGVGFHGHMRLNDIMAVDADVWKPQFAANIKRFNDLGLEVQITELDVSIVLPADDVELQNQATAFRDILDVCLKAERCTAFNMWGLTDKYSWILKVRPGEGAPLLYDDNYGAKPAYYAISERLSQPRK